MPESKKCKIVLTVDSEMQDANIDRYRKWQDWPAKTVATAVAHLPIDERGILVA